MTLSEGHRIASRVKTRKVLLANREHKREELLLYRRKNREKHRDSARPI